MYCLEAAECARSETFADWRTPFRRGVYRPEVAHKPRWGVSRPQEEHTVPQGLPSPPKWRTPPQLAPLWALASMQARLQLLGELARSLGAARGWASLGIWRVLGGAWGSAALGLRGPEASLGGGLGVPVGVPSC